MRRGLGVAATITLLSLLINGVDKTSIALAVETGTGTSTPAPADNRAGSLDDRIESLQNQVRLAHIAGQLTQEQAEQYQSELRQIGETEAESLAIAKTVPPVIELQEQLSLDRLEKNMALSMHDRQIATLDLSGRVAHLTDTIDAAETEGRLSAKDAAYLRAQLKLAMSDQSSALPPSKINYADALRTSLMLDRVMDRFGHLLQHRPYEMPDVQSLKDIDGKLEGTEPKEHLEELRQLSSKLNRSIPKQAAEKSIKGLSGDAALDYAAQLAWWRLLLTEDIGGVLAGLNPSELQAKIDRAIAMGLETGRLTPAEAQDLSLQLDTLVMPPQPAEPSTSAPSSSSTPSSTATSTSASASTASSASQSASASAATSAAAVQPGATKEGSPAVEQKVLLSLALARLRGIERRTEHPPTRLWAGIIAYHAAMDERIAEAVEAGRLTKEQAADIKSGAAKIEALEKSSRGPSGLDSKQALQIVLGLELLNVRLHHALKDRNVKAPDLDKLEAYWNKTLAEGIDLGKLDYNSKLVDKLAHVAQLKQAYSQGQDGLDNRAKLALAEEIQHNITLLKGEIHRDVIAPPQSLDVRLTALTKSINAAAASGVLPMARAGQYKAAVETIYNELLDGRRAATGITPAQTLAVANDIEAMQDQFEDEMREAATLPFQLAPHIKELARHIGLELAAGRISLNEASELIAQLDHNAERLAAASSVQGGLSHGEGLRLSYNLEQLGSHMESALNDQPNHPIDSSQDPVQIDSKLASALTSGKLSVEQAQKYRQTATSIGTDAVDFRASDHNLSYLESITLAVEWDKLSHAIDLEIAANKTAQDLRTRRLDLEQRIKKAAASHRVSSKDEQALLAALGSNAKSEASLRASGQALTFSEALNLVEDLDKTTTRVATLLKDQLSLKQKH